MSEQKEESIMKPALTAAEPKSSPEEFDEDKKTTAIEIDATEAVDSATITEAEVLLAKHTPIEENTSKNDPNDIEIVEKPKNVVNLEKESAITDNVQTFPKVNTELSFRRFPLPTYRKKNKYLELSFDEDFKGFEQRPYGSM